MRKPQTKILRDSIRGSVPDGKLKKARIVLHDIRQNATPTAGATQYGEDRKTVVRVDAPASDDAFGITVRGHEGRHATRHVLSRRKAMTPNEMLAGQIVDDVNIETTELPKMLGDGL